MRRLLWLLHPLVLFLTVFSMLTITACDRPSEPLGVNHGPLTSGDGPQPDYVDENGHRFVWQRKHVPVKVDPGAEKPTTMVASTSKDPPTVEQLAKDLRPHLFTPDGHEFLGDEDMNLAQLVAAGTMPPDTAAHMPAQPADDPSVKKSAFVIQGNSGIMGCSRLTQWPAPTEVWFDGGCSGAIIGHNTVVSAAHCFYDNTASQWVWNSKIVPAADDGMTTGCGPWPEPFGHWSNWGVTLPGCWMSGDNTCDYAVIVGGLGGTSGNSLIGDAVGGWLGTAQIAWNYTGALNRDSFSWRSPWRYPIEYYSNGYGQTTIFGPFKTYSNDSFSSDSGGGVFLPSTNQLVGVHKGEITYSCGWFSNCNGNIFRQWLPDFANFRASFGSN